MRRGPRSARSAPGFVATSSATRAAELVATPSRNPAGRPARRVIWLEIGLRRLRWTAYDREVVGFGEARTRYARASVLAVVGMLGVVVFGVARASELSNGRTVDGLGARFAQQGRSSEVVDDVQTLPWRWESGGARAFLTLTDTCAVRIVHLDSDGRLRLGRLVADGSNISGTCGDAHAVVADLNSDGGGDLVLAPGPSGSQFGAYENGGLSMQLADGYGSLSAPQTILPARADEPEVVTDVAAGDFTGHGHTDLAVAESTLTTFDRPIRPDGHGGILVLANDGHAHFSPPHRYLAGHDFASVAAVATPSGGTELAADSTDHEGLVILRREGHRLRVVQRFPSVRAGWITAATLNRGDRPSLLVSSSTNGDTVLLRATSSGTFTRPMPLDLQEEVYLRNALAVTDLNHDGRADIVAVGQGPDGGAELEVSLQRSDGTFAPAVPYPVRRASAPTAPSTYPARTPRVLYQDFYALRDMAVTGLAPRAEPRVLGASAPLIAPDRAAYLSVGCSAGVSRCEGSLSLTTRGRRAGYAPFILAAGTVGSVRVVLDHRHRAGRYTAVLTTDNGTRSRALRLTSPTREDRRRACNTTGSGTLASDTEGRFFIGPLFSQDSNFDAQGCLFHRGAWVAVTDTETGSPAAMAGTVVAYEHGEPGDGDSITYEVQAYDLRRRRLLRNEVDDDLPTYPYNGGVEEVGSVAVDARGDLAWIVCEDSECARGGQSAVYLVDRSGRHLLERNTGVDQRSLRRTATGFSWRDAAGLHRTRVS
jgi:hypothetical protein